MNGRGSWPATANPDFALNGVVDPPGPRDTDSTLGVFLRAAANVSSFVGSPLMAANNANPCVAGSRLAISSADVRSGSANKMSNPTTAAPFDASARRRSATVVLGQGHWPILGGDCWSISTMRIGG